MSLRKFAAAQADQDRAVVPPFRPWARNNWLRLATLVVESEWLHREMGAFLADEAIFSIACHSGLSAGEYDWELIPPFVRACVSLHSRRTAFHPDGSAEYMLWDLLRLWQHREAACPYRAELRDLLLEAMLDVLQLDVREAKVAALHGLGHHRDERARPAIKALIDSTDDEELRAYARAAYDFEVG